jgi:hypothetical protein
MIIFSILSGNKYVMQQFNVCMHHGPE